LVLITIVTLDEHLRKRKKKTSAKAHGRRCCCTVQCSRMGGRGGAAASPRRTEGNHAAPRSKYHATFLTTPSVGGSLSAGRRVPATSSQPYTPRAARSRPLPWRPPGTHQLVRSLRRPAGTNLLADRSASAPPRSARDQPAGGRIEAKSQHERTYAAGNRELAGPKGAMHPQRFFSFDPRLCQRSPKSKCLNPSDA
jgi:hypothetical protein